MFMCALCERAARFVCLSAFVITLLLIGNVSVFAQGGSLDFSFNATGYRYEGFGGGSDELRAIAVQPDGKIVAAGNADNIPGSGADFALVRYNTDGSLDLTFGGDGKVTTAIGPALSTDIAYAVALQADGKIVAAGYASGISGSGVDFAVVRYNADGSLDTSFDGDGKVTTAIAAGTGDEIAFAVSVQPDGKIVSVGHSSFDFAAVRLNADGSLDTTFDSDGRVVTPISAGAGADVAYAAALQPDGKLVAAGRADSASGTDFALVRFNTDGSLDTTFDGDGKVTTAIAAGTNIDIANAVAIQADGKIVAAGYGSGYATGTDFELVRYNTNGSLDTSFDTDGRVTTVMGGGTSIDLVNSVALQSDGKILALGRADTAFGTDFALARYNSNGSLDSTFDGDGRVTTPVGLSTDLAYALAVQADGKILAAGRADGGVPTLTDFAVVRYTSSGVLDATFDTDGKVTSDIGDNFSQSNAVAVQGDGNTIVAGSAGNDFAIVRYKVDGTLDTTFDGDGKVLTTLSSGQDIVYALAIQPDGKIVAAGQSSPSSPEFGLVRYNTDGSLDTSFDGDGKVITDVGTAFGNDVAYAIALQPDGKIVAAGHASTGSWWDMAVVRYNADGSLDTSFDSDGKALINIGSQNDVAYAVAIQADGKIVAAGIAALAASGGDFTAVRLNADGSLDTTFDSDGMVTTAIGPTTSYDEARGLAIQPDGKIIAAGRTSGIPGTGIDFALVRYNTDGSLDTAFDTDGIVTTGTATAGQPDFATSIVLQADGKIVAGGYAQVGSQYDTVFARYNVDGSLDTSFSGDGIAMIDLGGFEYVYAMAIYPNNRAVIAASGPNNFLTARVWLNVLATAAKVDLSGRVADTRGRAVSNVTLTLTDADGSSRTATTNTFGYYRFQKVEAGQSYVLHATSKKYAVEDPIRMIEVTDEMDEIDFVAEPIGPGRGKPSNPKPVKPTSKPK
jgi:uncharacterized delta-60 repeat protein